MNITAAAQRSEGWWIIRIPELPSVYSQSRQLSQVAAMAQEAAALYLDIPAEEIEVTVQLEGAPPKNRLLVPA